MILNYAKDIRFGNNRINRIYKGSNIIYGLPKDYTRLAYIYNTGNQWIETGIFPSLDMEFDTKIFVKEAIDDYFCSLRIDGGNTRNYLLNINGNYGFVATKSSWVQGTGYFGINGNTMKNRYFEIHSEIKPYYSSISIGQNQVRNSDASTLLSTQSFPLFGAKLNNSQVCTIYSRPDTRCCYAKFTDKGKVVRYFIPALDNNGRPCMYDLVTKQPFYNMGSGEFGFSLTE